MSHHDVPERLSSRAKGFAEDAGNQTMEVLVETLTGTAFEMTVSPSDTVLAIKSKIYRVEGIPVSSQHLLHGSQELWDGQSLGGAGLRPGARLRLVLRLRGGPVSTRLLPEPYRYRHREEEWVGCLTGCRVAVVILRDGERVRVLRVGGAPAPPPRSPRAPPPAPPAPSPQDRLTMTKMAALRRRLEDLSLRRRPLRDDTSSDIHKTRSEETLPGHRAEGNDPEDSDLELDYTYRLGASFADRYSLLPPLSGRALSAQWSAALDQDPPADGFDHHRELSPVWSGSFGSLLESPAPPPPHPAATPRLLGDCQHGILPSLSRHRNREHLHLSDERLHLTRPPLAMTLPPVAMAMPTLPPVAMDTAPNRRQRLERIMDMERALRVLHQEQQIVEVSPECAEEERLPLLPASVEGGAGEGSQSTGGVPKEGQGEKKRRLRCAWCRRRVTVSTAHSCGCGATLCAPHRYPEAHRCLHHQTAQSALPRI